MLYSEFVSNAKHFLQISDSINDGWVLKTYRDYVYLVKSTIQYLSNDDCKLSNESDELNENFKPDLQSVDEEPRDTRKWEYHILHSLSFQVPVLYFNVWKSSGELLSLDELWETVEPNFKNGVLPDILSTLTQQEHPYLFKPFFYFHPCQTENLLRSFSTPGCNKLISWLSSFGQIMWLRLNPVYGEKCLFQ